MSYSYFNEYAFAGINTNLLTSSCTLHRCKFLTHPYIFTLTFKCYPGNNYYGYSLIYNLLLIIFSFINAIIRFPVFSFLFILLILMRYTTNFIHQKKFLNSCNFAFAGIHPVLQVLPDSVFAYSLSGLQKTFQL